MFVNDTVAARRLATIALRRMRLMRSYAYRIMPGSSMERLPLEPTERVTINNPTNGLNGVRAQLISNRINPDWSLSLNLIEDRDGIYDTASADPEPPDELPEPITPVTPVPSGITGTEETVGGSYFLRLSWDAYDGRTAVQYRISTETPPFTILSTYDASISIPVEVGSTYLYKLRHISPQGVTSGWSTEITWSPAGDTSAPAAPTGLTLTGVVGGYQAEWDLPSEADYLHTKILDGASDATLSDATLRGTISGTSFTRLGLGIDTVKVFVRHVDQAGNEGTATNANVTPLSSFSWQGAWEALADYEVGAVVLKSGSSHICIQAHSSTTTNAPDVSGGDSYWDSLAAKGSTGGSGDKGDKGEPSTVKGDKGAGFSWEDAWEALEDYVVGDVVAKSGSSHICIQAHSSTTTNAPDVSGGDSYWDSLAAKGGTGGSGDKGDKGEPSTVKGDKGAGFSWEDAWEALEDYVVGDVVAKSGSSHICIQAHSSTTTNAPDVSGGDSYWDSLAAKGGTGGSGDKGDKGEPSTVKGDKGAGFSWEDAWEALEDYVVGDVVAKSGSSHICIQAHSSTTTNAPDVSGGDSYWDSLAAKGSTGSTGATGAKGDKGNTGAKGDKGSTGATGAKGDKGNTGATGAKGDKGSTGSTGATGAKGNKGAGFSWEDDWEALATYAVGDVVAKSGSSHICIQAHTSTTTNAPDASGGDSYWDILSAKGSTGSTGATGAKGDKGDKGQKGQGFG